MKKLMSLLALFGMMLPLGGCNKKKEEEKPHMKKEHKMKHDKKHEKKDKHPNTAEHKKSCKVCKKKHEVKSKKMN